MWGQLDKKASEQNINTPYLLENYYTEITEYDSENGLPGKFSSYIFKDSRGLLWMTSLAGLHRFDGRDFKLFNTEKYLPFNLVMEIYEDSEGYFWLYKSCFRKNEDNCDKSLVFFNPITYDTLSLAERFGGNTPFLPSEIEHITANKKGNVFCIRTATASYRWFAGKGFEILPSNKIVSIPYVFSILADGRMGAYYKDSEVFVYYLLNASGEIIFQQKLSDPLLPNGFAVFPYTMESQQRFLNFRNTIRYESKDSFFIYQVNEEGGLVRNGLFSKIPLHLEHGARHIFFDEMTQTFWNADRRGVQRHELRKKRFHNVAIDEKGAMVRMTQTLDNNKVLISGSMGKNSENVLFHYDRLSAKKMTRLKPLNEDSKMPSKAYLSLDNDFFSTPLALIISKEGKYFNLNRENILFDSTHIEKFFFVKKIKQQLWIGTLSGLWIFDMEKRTFEKYDAYNQFTQFLDCSARLMAPIDDDKYWIGTGSGLFLLSLKEGILEHYNQEQKGRFYLPISIIYDAEPQEDGSVLLATREGFVHLARKENGYFENGQHFTLISKKEGLPRSICSGVYTDDYGFYWLSTSSGIVQIEIATGRIKIYNKKNGLDFDYFHAEGHHEAPNGELYFGALGGFVHFHPKDFKDENFGDPDIPFIIVDFEQYNQQTEKFETKTQELLNNHHITLSPKGKIFNLRVALSDYRGADKHQFAYRILGYQEEWQEGKSNVIRISGLPVGQHILEIKGRFEDGRFSSHVLAIPITVLSEIYFRWWFILSVVIVLISGGVFIYNQRTRRSKNRQIELEKLVKERTQTIAAQTEELRSLDEMKSRFFANISHELRTPLTLMLAPIENTLKRDKLENRDVTNLLMAKHNGKHLEKMVNEILDLTKLAAGKLELKPTKLVWYNFLKIIISNFESLANRKQIDYQFQYEGNKYLQVQLDPHKTEIILLNLLSNAFKFTPKGGQIMLRVKNDGESLIIEVEDNGRGIHPKDLPYIFDRFYQTKQTPAGQKNIPAEGGTGIGLALAKEFIQLMSGKIEAKSNLEKGTIFRIYIPKIEIISQLNEAEVAATNEPVFESSNKFQVIDNELIINNKTTKPTILLVEDNLDLQSFISTLLMPKYEVITADNGQEALEILRKQDEKIELILSDVMMPFMDGFQLLNWLKSNEKYRCIPVIMLTARAAKADRLKALRIGVDDYLTKPFIQEELLVRIENLLKNAQMRQVALEAPAIITIESTEKRNLSTQEEQAWLMQLEENIFANIENFNYTLDDLAQDMLLSKRQLHRRINQLIGQTPNEYIKTLRLTKARELLETRQETIIKVLAYSVGFKDVSYFSKQFKKAFGKLPSEY